MILSADNVAFSYDGNSIFTGVAFEINEGDRIGLVGENGAGKTTLIKLMTGELSPDAGTLFRKNGLKIGYLEQNGGYESENTVYGEMRRVFSREIEAVEKLAGLSQKLSECEYGGREYSALSAKIEALEKFVASHDCYNVDVRIKTVLNGMGFADFYGRQISSMSGGEKTRLKLARLLLSDFDLLILDEPTNHLDVKTLFWLEDFLSSYKGALFVVSHDRFFLDKIAGSVAEIENGRFTLYRGNYTKYKELKRAAYERAQKEYLSYVAQVEKLQTYIDKNIVRATTAKSAQSRVKQLEKLPEAEKPFLPPPPPRFKFTCSQQPSEAVILIDDLNLSIGGKSLIVGGQLKIRRGEKVALVGENGAGKSTLLREIVGGKNPLIALGRYVAFSYYDQETANLDPGNTVLEELWGRHISFSQTEARAALARCGLEAGDIDKKVSSLSGGERAKLALCVFENAGGNVLVLDEPTNHLDLPARESLEEALRAFDGTVIFVSHDRYFISAVAGRIVEIEDKKLNVYDCGYEDFRKKKEELAAIKRAGEEQAERIAKREERERSYRSGKERAEEAKRRAEIKALESGIAAAEEEENALNCLLADPLVTADYKKVKEITDKLRDVRENIERLYSRYGEIIG